MNLWRFAIPDSNAAPIQGAYDLWLVALSLLIAVAGALAMLRAVARFAAAERSASRRLWAASAAASMACGIWAMHFTGMLALMLPVHMDYDVALTALSILPAVAASLVAVHVLGGAALDARRMHGGAALIGGGIGAMHYAGMEAMRFDGYVRYDAGAFAVSICAAYALSLLALRVRRGSSVPGPGALRRDLSSALLLGCAVAAMHYIAMASAAFYATGPGGAPRVHASPLVAIGIALGTVLILGVVWIASLVDRRLASIGASLRRSEALNGAVIVAMSDAHFLADAQGRILSLNPAALKMFGYTPEEIGALHVPMLVPNPRGQGRSAVAQDENAWPRALSKSARGLDAIRKDGARFPIELMVKSFKIEGEEYFSGTVRDLSEFAATIENTKRLMAAVDQANEGIAILDQDLRVTYANPRFWAVAGSAPEQALGRPVDEVAWRRSGESPAAAMRAALEGGRVWTGSVAGLHADGSPMQETITTTPVTTDGGIACYIMIRRDVTEQLRMEQQLRHVQKLESIGQLSAGIAHELNTPSQFVRDNIVFLKDGYAQLLELVDTVTKLGAAGDRAAVEAAIDTCDLRYLRDEIPRAIEQSLDGMNRITKIVRAMKEFSHQSTDKLPSNLNNAIESTITVATSEWKYVADMVLDLDPMLPPVPCALDEFNQVVLNLVVNAAHAIGDVVGPRGLEKGEIRISTRSGAEHVEIRISDTGTGMTPQVRARIFEPFFTTKEVGKGTGQGLSIAYAVIVERHGGSIDVETEVGKGSCFVIRLPIVPQESGRVSSAAA